VAIIDSLESFWELEANGNDSHGSNNLTDEGVVTYTTGKVGNCANFELDSGQRLYLASNSSLQTGDIDFTFAQWVQLESNGAAIYSAGKWTSAGDQREWFTRYDPGSNRFEFFASADGASSTIATANNFGAPSLATWYFLVVWHNATANTINIQVNDGTANSFAHAGGIFLGSGLFNIGARGDGSGWDGLGDQVGFWKGLLSDAERTWLYNSGAGRSYADIVAEASGGVRRFLLMR